MGVRHLQTFVTDHVPDGFYEISLINECKKFQRLHQGQKPILVIDLMGLVHNLCIDPFKLLCGGQHNKYILMLETFFRCLVQVADLVFFQDGPLLDEKLTTWFQRQNGQYEDMIKVIDMVNEQKDVEFIVQNSLSIPQISTNLNAVEFMAKKYGKLIVSITKECDTELAQYASSNSRVLAILADDSDFLIYSGDWRYWSQRNVNVETLKTMEYDRKKLREFLDLNDDQMKILSTLAGNDLIQYDIVKHFHKKNHCGFEVQKKFPWLANYIRENLNLKQTALIAEIGKEVLRTENITALKSVADSLTQYNTDFKISTLSDPLLQFCMENHLIFCFLILRGHKKCFNVDYYDLEKENFPLLHNVTTCLFSKKCGILLKHKRKQHEFRSCTIRTKKTHHEEYREFTITPIYPKDDLPPLLEILNRKEYPEHDALRFKLLAWLIDEKKLKNVNLELIPQNFFLDILVLCFLTSHGFITTSEADLILVTIKKVELNEVPKNLTVPQSLHTRAFEIAFLFTKFHSNIARSLQVTGLAESKMKILNFDGVYFHHIYWKMIENDYRPLSLLADLENYRYYA